MQPGIRYEGSSWGSRRDPFIVYGLALLGVAVIAGSFHFRGAAQDGLILLGGFLTLPACMIAGVHLVLHGINALWGRGRPRFLDAASALAVSLALGGFAGIDAAETGTACFVQVVLLLFLIGRIVFRRPRQRHWVIKSVTLSLVAIGSATVSALVLFA